MLCARVFSEQIMLNANVALVHCVLQILSIAVKRCELLIEGALSSSSSPSSSNSNDSGNSSCSINCTQDSV